MPLYEYKCHTCGRTFEALEKFSDEPLKIHAGCGGEVERLLSAPAFHLKGTGWYATDYAKTPPPAAKTEDGKSGDTAKSDSKTDGKPAESKSTESKPAETKTTETKPVTASPSESK